FQFFMKGNRWYQELHRMHDYSRRHDRGFGAGQFLAYTAPRKRLRMLGAPESVFASNPPVVLSAALNAYRKREYAACRKAVVSVIEKGEVNGLELQKAEQLREAAILIQKSIEHDLSRVNKRMAENRFYEASLDLVQLAAVLPESSAELAELEEKLSAPALNDALKQGRKDYDAYIKSLQLQVPEIKDAGESEWHSLVSEKVFRRKAETPEPTVWRMKVLESISLAPRDWPERGFNDSAWAETTMPISWHINHTALFRAPFEIADRSAVKSLRLRQYAFRQENMKIYINGTLVAKISAGGGAGGANEFELNDHAVKALRDGPNILAATYQHVWRWGRYTRGKETEEQGSVYHQGVHLALDMQGKDEDRK
ncbi:MAG: hypothetical protein AAF492_00660, partial [Verrucomicrobiota bacterium]